MDKNEAKRIEEQIKKFKEETGVKLEIKDDKPFYEGNLNLVGKKLTQLPDNLTVSESMDLTDSSIKVLPDNLTVGGFLSLHRTYITK